MSNEIITLVKDTSLARTIAIMEMHHGRRGLYEVQRASPGRCSIPACSIWPFVGRC
ncbi:MAG: hypothetical protein ACLSHO_01120 [Dysosmobacter sp.]